MLFYDNGVFLIQENGAELRHLSSEPIQTDCSKIVFLVRCHPSLMEFILSNIQYDISKGLKKDYFIYFVPRRTVACEKVCPFINKKKYV